ncbi:MAG: peptide deformylase [Candidatus Methylacidiphilales bacterium]|nr:peptide deformylase [Candidatus Methylacidiphilales bacterium]
MILPIIPYGHAVLRKKGRTVPAITPEIRQLVADMIETMRAAHGVGLAAQQIGQDLQLCVIEITPEVSKERPSRKWVDGKETDPHEHMPLVLVNPVIEMTKKKETGPEGCLSFPGLTADIVRGYRVKVTHQDLEGKTHTFEAAGLLGRAVQHEYDHLQGVLFIDRMDPADRAELKDEIEALRRND